MFVCVVSSQPSSRDQPSMLNVCVCCLVVSVSLPHPSSRDLVMLNVCVLSRCLSPVVETRDVKCLYVCVVLLSQPSSRDLVMLNVCVWCLVVSAQ